MKFFLTSSCLLLLSLSVWAQKVVTGQIIGTDKEPIIGVAILEKGTASGTTTDIEGNFSLAVAGDSSVLVVSYIGFKTQEIPVAGLTTVAVTLAEDIKELDEVVIIGYGTVRKSDLTGSVASLKEGDMKQVPSQNVMEAIQGKAAGVDITRTSGQAGSSPNIIIRGTRSITANNDPLYIVDGIQYSGIQDINPGDIMSMEILKDASSTAIYGSRGANGVVIITTKKGAAGDLKVTVNSYIGMSEAAKFPKAMNGQQYIDLKRQALRTQAADATGGVDNPDLNAQNLGVAQEMQNLANGHETDYIKELLHKGLQKDFQVGVAGGNEKLKSYFSLGYFNETGLVKNDEITRYTGRLNVDYQVHKYVKVGTQTQITSYDQSRRVNSFTNAAKLVPLTKPFDDNGNYVETPHISGPPTNGTLVNPLIDERSNAASDMEARLKIFPTLYLEVTPLKGLTGRTNLSVNWDDISRNVFQSANSYNRFNQKSFASHLGDYSRNINWQGIINYNKVIAKDHSVAATVLSEILINKREVFTAQGEDQLIPEQTFYNLAGAQSNIKVSSRYSKNSLVSFAGRLNYAFKGKYLLTLTGRQDGASQLSEGNKWDFFPSVAAGWRLSDERFMAPLTQTFSTVKLRGSWGISGNASVVPYSTQSVLSNIPFGFGDSPALAYGYNQQIGNDALKWEKSKTWDIGLDLGLLRDRISLTADYYDTRTSGLLLTRALPPSTGVVQTVQNIGKTHNRGIELAITSVNVQTKKFKWTTTLNFMRNVERITELVSGQPIMTVTDYNNNTKIVAVDAPVNSFYDYEKIGIWQLVDAEAIAQHNAANPGYQVRPGDIRIKDQNGDGKITIDDRKVIGSQVPKWSAGLNSEFKFLNFDLSLNFFARFGQTVQYNALYDPSATGNSVATREYWTPENPTNDLPRPGRTQAQDYRNTFQYQDGSFLKLRSATLGYSLPTSLTEKFRISRLRVYITGKNLWTYSRIKDYDSEMNGSFSFPSVRLYVAGFNLEF